MTCFNSEEQPTETPVKQNEQMTEQDKAVLGIKKNLRKLTRYCQDLEQNSATLFEKAKEAKKEGNQAAALRHMKRRKLYQKYLDGARGQEMMVQETLDQYRSARMDVDVMKAMKDSQSVIDDLREKANIEDFEHLVEKQQETNAERDELTDLLAENGISEDDVMAEMADLEAELAGEEMGASVPTDQVSVGPAKEEAKEEVRSKQKTAVVA